MQLPPAVIVHGLADARAALAPGLPVTLLSARGAALYAGCGWWLALVTAARADTTRPRVLRPDVPPPGPRPPDPPRPDVAGPDVAGPDAPRPNVAKPDLVGPDMAGPDGARPDVAGPYVPCPDVPRPDLPHPDVPHPDVIDVLDCADGSGQAMAALRIGLCRLVLWPGVPGRDAVAAIAAAAGGFLLPEAPPALDLAERGARRRLAGWLQPVVLRPAGDSSGFLE